VKALRDLTRGGLAMALHDLAGAAGVSVRLEEARLPTDPAQEAACELLGLDPLQIACEGRFLAVLPAGAAAAAVALLRQEAPCREAAVVGEVVARGEVPVEVVTAIGTRRVLSPPRGEQMPRIC
jgi:hydrogenase expression/formation protein HypE